MKSIKLASGFAVSALALAIAGQAVAQEATTEVDFTGSVKVQSVFDLENDTRENQMPGYSSANEDWFHLEATWAVSHGPFSGNLIVGLSADEDDDDAMRFVGGAEPNGEVRVEDLMVEEGPVSFGQIGSVADTAGLLESLTDFDALGETALDYGVDAAARYTVADLGLKVQAEGSGDDFGIAAGVMQDLDVATVWADVQYREDINDDEDGMEDGTVAYGFGVEAMPVDMVTLTAVFRGDTAENFGADEDEDTQAFGVRADVQATDEISVYALFADNETALDDNAAFKLGGTAEFAPLTFEGSYEAKAAEAADGLIFGKVSYTDGPIGAFAEVHYNLEDFLAEGQEAGTKFVLGADYTYDSGVVVGAEYENAGEDFWDADSDVSTFTAFSQYKF